MIDPAYVRRMARYNGWQNQNLYGCADGLSDAERRRERGAFFGSIHKTLSHLLWADQIWMSRFTDVQRPDVGIPESVSLYPDWDDLKQKRAAFDEIIIDWADNVDAAALAGDTTWYSGGFKRDLTRPTWQLVMHFFNHETHHRGQVHCMLTKAGVKAHVSDLLAMPE